MQTISRAISSYRFLFKICFSTSFSFILRIRRVYVALERGTSIYLLSEECVCIEEFWRQTGYCTAVAKNEENNHTHILYVQHSIIKSLNNVRNFFVMLDHLHIFVHLISKLIFFFSNSSSSDCRYLNFKVVMSLTFF